MFRLLRAHAVRRYVTGFPRRCWPSCLVSFLVNLKELQYLLGAFFPPHSWSPFW